MLSWTALAAAILITVPVRVVLHVNVGSKMTFEMVIYIYAMRIQLDGLIDQHGYASFHLVDREKHVLSISRIASFARNLLRNAISRRIDIMCHIGTGDACTTALAAGGLLGVLRALSTRWNAVIFVQPYFDRVIFKMSGRCILCFRGGDIILAGMKAFNGQLPKK